MSFLYAPRPFREEHKREAVAELLDRIVPDRDFYVLLVGGILIAVLAIFLDSIAVLIASMIIAPLSYPILGLSLGIVSMDLRLTFRSFLLLLVSLFTSLAGAVVLTLCFGNVSVDPVFITFESNLYIATAIAVIAGFIAAYGLVRPKVGGAATGVGIAVSLMPPLVATGIAIASPGSFPAEITWIVFLLNVFGIIIGSALMFMILRIHSKKQ